MRAGASGSRCRRCSTASRAFSSRCSTACSSCAGRPRTGTSASGSSATSTRSSAQARRATSTAASTAAAASKASAPRASGRAPGRASAPAGAPSRRVWSSTTSIARSGRTMPGSSVVPARSAQRPMMLTGWLISCATPAHMAPIVARRAVSTRSCCRRRNFGHVAQAAEQPHHAIGIRRQRHQDGVPVMGAVRPGRAAFPVARLAGRQAGGELAGQFGRRRPAPAADPARRPRCVPAGWRTCDRRWGSPSRRRSRPRRRGPRTAHRPDARRSRPAAPRCRGRAAPPRAARRPPGSAGHWHRPARRRKAAPAAAAAAARARWR